MGFVSVLDDNGNLDSELGNKIMKELIENN